MRRGHSPDLRRALPALLGLVAVALGVWVRSYGWSRSLWLDEAWVANSVAAPTLSEALYYPRWIQTTPPGFVLLQRASIAIAGDGPAALRALPAAAGIAAIPAVGLAAARMIGPWFGAAAALSLALAPQSAAYAVTLKQYSVDLCAASALLLGASGGLRRLRLWLAAYAALSFLSLPTVFFAPGLALVAWHGGVERREKAARAGATLAVAGACAAIHYGVFVRPNLRPVLFDFWSGGFAGPDWPLPLFYGWATRAISWDLPTGPSRAGALLAAAGMGLGLAARLFAAGRSRPGAERRLLDAAICALPGLGALVANGIGVYPLGEARLTLFLVPPAMVLLFMGVEAALSALPGGEGAGGAWRAPLPLALAAIPLALRPLPSPPVIEDMQGALSGLSARAGDGDGLYVHATARETFDYYARRIPLPAMDVRYGDTGWACCSPIGRGREGVIHVEAPAEDLRAELEALAPAEGGRWFLLMTGREDHWWGIRRDDPSLLADWMRDAGCAPLPGPTWVGAELQAWDCGAGRGARRPWGAGERGTLR